MDNERGCAEQKNTKHLKILIISILWAGNLAYLFPPSLPDALKGLSRNRSEAAGQLQCSQIEAIARWSRQRYVGSQIELDSASFSKSLAEEFAEQLDPYRILFTQADLEKLQKAAPWKEVWKKGTCQGFSDWAGLSLETAKLKLVNRVGRLTIEAEPQTEISPSTNFTAPQRTSFAKNEEELLSRLNELANIMVENAYPKLLSFYQNDTKALVWKTIDQFYFEQRDPVPNVVAKALVNTIDPYSTYFSNEEFDDFYSSLSGGTSGIGIQIRRVPVGLIVEKVLEDSPARRAGLKSGDIIQSVNGVGMMNVGAKVARKALQGDKNNGLKLVLNRNGTLVAKALAREEFNFEDGKVSSQTIRSEGKTVGVIKVPSFFGRGGMKFGEMEKSSSDEVETALTELMKRSPRAIVLDLRGNPGGYLEEAVTMASLFLGERAVVGIYENNQLRTYRNRFREKALYNGPLVVLVDEESASAAEVLAGALQDHKRALVVGSSRTYGKGTIQRLYHLNNEMFALRFGGHNPMPGVVKITTSVFYSPMGKSPAAGGVRADIALAEVKEKKDVPKLPAVSLKVEPFLDRVEVKEISARSQRIVPRLQRVKRRSQIRMAKELRASLPEEKKEERMLDETVEIAIDYAKTHRQDSNL